MIDISCVVLAKTENPSIKGIFGNFIEILVLVDSQQKNTKTIKKDSSTVMTAFHPLDQDFAAQRNYALSLCTKTWVLFVDEDEEVPQNLMAEIAEAILRDDNNGYMLHRNDIFMNRELKHGETGNIRLLRLAKKSAGNWERPVHEVWQVTGNIGVLSSPLIHRAHPSISAFLDKINAYTSIEANYRKNLGKRTSLFELLVYPHAKFFQNYLFRLGFLDGIPGFTMAFMMSLHSLAVRIKLYEA
ncbi:MAG TPA: glycosyltransferase family 2 protein [Candidatus Saccharimonadia bacterium]|nr:glycosyltransferase family 2 protein [Candidatus Saccharimonadia bacterium]